LYVLGSSVHKVLANKGPKTIKESDAKLWDNRRPKGENTHLKKRCSGCYPCATMLGQKYTGTTINFNTPLTHKIRDDKKKVFILET